MKTKETTRPKTGGRKKGTPNKNTAEIKNYLVDFVFDNKKKFEDGFKKLSKEEQFAALLNIMLKLSPKDIAGKLSFDDETTKLVKETTDKINSIFK